MCHEITCLLSSCTILARNRCALHPITGLENCFKNCFTYQHYTDINKANDGSPSMFSASDKIKLYLACMVLAVVVRSVHEYSTNYSAASGKTTTVPQAALVSQEEVWLCMAMQLSNPFPFLFSYYHPPPPLQCQKCESKA